MSHTEEIISEGRRLAYVIRGDFEPTASTFVTDASEIVQVGFVVVPDGGEVVRHDHLPVARSIVGTAEVLVVRAGACEMDVFDEARELVATVDLAAGDVVVFLGVGGHAFRSSDHTVFIEVKQGPYGGDSDKERF